MNTAVLLSIRPEWVEKILGGEKTLEIRKSYPRLDVPFKCYIYMTRGYASYPTNEGTMICHNNGGQCVVGEFVCDYIERMRYPEGGLVDAIDAEMSCLTAKEIIEYSGGKRLYGWHISDLKVYKEPKLISDFLVEDNRTYDCPQLTPMRRPPQSWCYVEGLQ